MRCCVITVLLILCVFQEVDANSSHVTCTLTKSVQEVTPLPQYVPSSNHTRHAEMHDDSAPNGQPVLIAGTLRAENCTPIDAARVVLWYQFDHLAGEDEAIIYAAEAYSNNLGEFVFIANMPTVRGQLRPVSVLNMQVSHRDYRRFSSQLLLPGVATSLPTRIAAPLTAKPIQIPTTRLPAFSYFLTLKSKKLAQTKQF